MTYKPGDDYERVGQLHITWYANQTSPEQRAELRAEIAAVKTPRRPRRGKLEPHERRGERALAEPDELGHRGPRSRAYVVRVYYWSEGGELLCFHAGPMSQQAAWTLRGEVAEPAPRQVFDRASGKWRTAAPEYRRVPPAEEWKVDELANHPPAQGARLVVLPSQASQAATLAPPLPPPRRANPVTADTLTDEQIHRVWSTTTDTAIAACCPTALGRGSPIWMVRQAAREAVAEYLNSQPDTKDEHDEADDR